MPGFSRNRAGSEVNIADASAKALASQRHLRWGKRADRLGACVSRGPMKLQRAALLPLILLAGARRRRPRSSSRPCKSRTWRRCRPLSARCKRSRRSTWSRGCRPSSTRWTSPRAAWSPEGQLLFELQKGPYQAAVLQAQGSLAQAQATLQNAPEEPRSATRQAGTLAISQQQIQQDTAARDQAAGQVDVARGALEVAAINLSYCTVAAPIAGRIGRANITAGNLVDSTSGPLATIVQIDADPGLFRPHRLRAALARAADRQDQRAARRHGRAAPAAVQRRALQRGRHDRVPEQPGRPVHRHPHRLGPLRQCGRHADPRRLRQRRGRARKAGERAGGRGAGGADRRQRGVRPGRRARITRCRSSGSRWAARSGRTTSCSPA